MIKIKFHSIVDVITNSSTVIFTYQNSITQAKELVDEVLKLQGIKNKSADDIFYFGVFCDSDKYLESNEEIEGKPEVTAKYHTKKYDEQITKEVEWLHNLQLSIMKGEIKRPQWMEDIETDDSQPNPDSYLTIVVKDEKYKKLGELIEKLLCSVDAEGGGED